MLDELDKLDKLESLSLEIEKYIYKKVGVVDSLTVIELVKIQIMCRIEYRHSV